MGPVEITLKNYRCFQDAEPATFRIGGGITAFVGPNNAGKSTLLKSLYELRGLFAALADENNLQNFAAGNPVNTGDFFGIEDTQEILCNANDRDLSVELKFP